MRKDAKENRQRIEEIAHKLFDEEGVENISMNRIAKELGIGMGTLYRHFKDKSDLCYYVIQRDLDIFITHFKQIKDDYHSNYEVMQVSLDYLLQFKSIIRHYCNVLKQATINYVFTKAHFIKNYLIFIMTYLKAMTTLTRSSKQICCCNHYQLVYLPSK